MTEKLTRADRIRQFDTGPHAEIIEPPHSVGRPAMSDERLAECSMCGGRMSRNPHPDAGKAYWRAVAAEGESDRLRAENERMCKALGSALSFIDKVPGRDARQLYYGIVDSLPRDSDGRLSWQYAALLVEPRSNEPQWHQNPEPTS